MINRWKGYENEQNIPKVHEEGPKKQTWGLRAAWEVGQQVVLILEVQWHCRVLLLSVNTLFRVADLVDGVVLEVRCS